MPTTAARAAAAAAKAFPYDPDLRAEFERAFVASAFAERRRVGAILSLPEAQGRQPSAQVIALETDLTVEEAARLLAATPKIEDGDPLAFLDGPLPGATDTAARAMADHARMTGRPQKGRS
ncbi:MAG: hypothetical protein JNK46_09450 [Methylobacteriaceae bacterium]|nr:hypothetical protein [Methylobacteriaceae bacterium]